MEDGINEIIAAGREAGYAEGIRLGREEGWSAGVEAGRELGERMGSIFKGLMAMPSTDEKVASLFEDILRDIPLENIEDPEKEQKLSRIDARYKELCVKYNMTYSKPDGKNLSF